MAYQGVVLAAVVVSYPTEEGKGQYRAASYRFDRLRGGRWLCRGAFFDGRPL